MYDESSDIKNFTAFAIFSDVPILHNEMPFVNSFISAFESPEFISVSITPGDMQLTLIPLGPTSLARAFVNPIRPAFAAEYTTSHDAPASPQIDDMLIMFPLL